MDQFEIQLEIEPIHDKYPGKIKKYYIYLEHFRFYGFKTNFKVLYKCFFTWNTQINKYNVLPAVGIKSELIPCDKIRSMTS